MSGAITQSGPVVVGHVPVFIGNGTVQDAGPADGGFVTQFGITNDGLLAFGINTGVITGPYTQFGAQVSSNGTVTLSAQSFNGGPSANVVWDINGVQYPFNPSGNGNITGPVSSTNGGLLAFNGTGGNLVEDTGVVAANVVQGPVSAVDDHLAVFNGVTGKLIEDSGISLASIVAGPTVAVSGDIATFDGVTGSLIKDSGVSAAPLLTSVSNIAALRATTTATLSSAQCYVFGYYGSTDGGEGLFVVGNPAADNGGTIIVNASGFTWHRETGGLPFSVKWFGAKGDAVTDDAAAFNATIAAAGGGPIVVPYSAAGYLIGSTVTGGGAVSAPNYRVNTTPALPFDGIDQTKFADAPVMNYTFSENFGYSVRNCKFTAYQIYASIGTTAFYDALQGVAHLRSGSPSTLNQMTGIAGYVKNEAVQISGQVNAVAVFGAATAEVDGAASWGINTLLQDSPTRNAGVGTGRQLLNEFDFNVMETGTAVNGCLLQGSSLAQPLVATAFGCGYLAPPAPEPLAKWTNGFLLPDGVASTAIAIGRMHAASTPNDSSQPITLIARDNSSNTQLVTLTAVGGLSGTNTTFFVNSTAPLALSIGGPSPIGLVIGTHKVVGPQVPGWGVAVGGTRAQLNPGTGTLSQAISALNALIFDLLTHGLIAS